jgi:hypothetical protein
MKIGLTGIGLVALGCCQVATAQNLLANLSLAQTATATTLSTDYRYTRHTTSGSGRGGHPGHRYSWDPFTDQTTSSSLPLQWGSVASATSTGTFYAPTYSASATGVTSLTNTPARAVLTANFSATTTLTTPLGAHQAVFLSAQSGGTISFTLTGYANVRVSATGSQNGVFRLFGPGVGVLVGPLYGAGTLGYDGPLAPGSYWVTTSLVYSSGENAQLGTSTNPGTTSAVYGFNLTLDSLGPPASVSGNVILSGLAPTAAAQTLTFLLRDEEGNSVLTSTLALGSGGEFTLSNVLAGTYTLHVTGSKWLARNVEVDTTEGDVSGLRLRLLPGDINGDNKVDILDLGLLADAFNTDPTSPHWNVNADLNCDGKVDIVDLGLLADSFGKTGDP